MVRDREERGAIDQEFLGLEDAGGPGRTSFVVAPALSRFDRRLYGGTAIAVSLAAIERVAGRDALWATTQFVSTAPTGARLECHAEVLAAGRRTTQVRVACTVDGDIVFVALGAAGDAKPGGLTGTQELRPTVVPPGEAPPAFTGFREDPDVGWHLAAEIRFARIEQHPAPGPGRMCLWVRFRDRRPVTAARLGFIADMVPVSIARGCGVNGAGVSLDNTLRIGPLVDTEWVLVDLRPHLANGGYGHGTVHLWADDGTLLATGSQSATMLVFEHDPLTGFPPG